MRSRKRYNLATSRMKMKKELNDDILHSQKFCGIFRRDKNETEHLVVITLIPTSCYRRHQEIKDIQAFGLCSKRPARLARDGSPLKLCEPLISFSKSKKLNSDNYLAYLYPDKHNPHSKLCSSASFSSNELIYLPPRERRDPPRDNENES